jgi:hypothetical protein
MMMMETMENCDALGPGMGERAHALKAAAPISESGQACCRTPKRNGRTSRPRPRTRKEFGVKSRGKLFVPTNSDGARLIEARQAGGTPAPLRQSDPTTHGAPGGRALPTPILFASAWQSVLV